MKGNKLLWLVIMFVCLITLMITLSVANLGGGYSWYTYVIVIVGLIAVIKSIMELSK